ncbi:MAG: DUF2752 domain-containing protein [Egibacteraceae bacterium]
MTTPPGIGRIRVERHDGHVLATLFGLTVLGAGSAFAVFGLPNLPLHGPLHYAGVMGPLCGMTRAITALLRGDIPTALTYNPAAPLVLLSSVALAIRGLAGVLTGAWVSWQWRPSRAAVAVMVTGAVGLAVRQQLHASFLA